jgi:3-oxoacyl-[acyl-carrier protein] reductase
MDKLFRLDGKVALVTGASRGLGKAMALALAKAGADLAVNARTESALAEVVAEVKKLGRKVIAVPGDVSQESVAQAIVDSVCKQMGRIDILLNNAGVWEGSYLVRLKKEDWDQVMQVNLTGVFLLSKAAGKAMLKQKSGKIINMSSILGFKPSPQTLAYSATKAALIQMTRVMALELGPAGVQVNAIAPGFFFTDMTKRYSENEEAIKAYEAKSPSRRCGRPEDLEGIVVFLASKAADHVTGQTIAIDGGESLA